MNKEPTLYTAKVEGKNKNDDPLLKIRNENDEVILDCTSIEAFELINLIPLLLADMVRTNKELDDEQRQHCLQRLNDTVLQVGLKLLVGQVGIPLNDVVRVDWSELDKIKEGE